MAGFDDDPLIPTLFYFLIFIYVLSTHIYYVLSTHIYVLVLPLPLLFGNFKVFFI